MDMTRRAVFGATTLAATITLTDVRRANSQETQRTFLLVHGAWHGGWCWRRIADLLTARGHKVFTPTLTGLGERSHLLTADVGLNTHIADVVNVMKWERLKDVVLVGHSYAGLVISGVAEQQNDNIASIVFLDAFVPDDGKGLYDYASPQSRSGMDALVQKGEFRVPPLPAAFFKVNEKDAAWVDALCTPQSLKTFTDKVASTGGREKIAKKTYVRSIQNQNPAYDLAYQKVRGDNTWRTYEITTGGHDSMIDEPGRVTEILLEVA